MGFVSTSHSIDYRYHCDDCDRDHESRRIFHHQQQQHRNKNKNNDGDGNEIAIGTSE